MRAFNIRAGGLALIDLQSIEDVRPPIDPASLRDLLRAHRDVVREDRELLAELGLRIDAANLVDFGPVALSRSSAAHERVSTERQRLEAIARANFEAQAQTHAGVVDLLDAESLADLALRLDEMARTRFGLAAGVLALEGPGSTPPGWLALAGGQVGALLRPGRATVMGRLPTACGLFGEQARHVASAALGRLELGDGGRRQGVVAFGSPDPDAFGADMGPDLVLFLATVAERTARRWTLA